jgi:hypothetical protein
VVLQRLSTFVRTAQQGHRTVLLLSRSDLQSLYLKTEEALTVVHSPGLTTKETPSRIHKICDNPAKKFEWMSRIFPVPLRDVLDEVDFLLSHRHHLVYAALPQHDDTLHYRIDAAQLLLQSLIGETDWIAKYGELIDRAPGGLDCLFVLRQQTSELDAAMKNFKRDVAARCIRGLADGADSVAELVEYATNLDSSHAIPQRWPPDKAHIIACFRGYFAFGVFELCFRYRHRVNYGIALTERRERIAVPFDAAEQPSQRNNFANTDVTILLTFLSYMRRGLSQEDFIDALCKLRGKGRHAAEEELMRWSAERERFAGEAGWQLTLPTVKDILISRHVSPFCDYFSLPSVIAFWLHHCQLAALMQSASETQAVACHLAHPYPRAEGCMGTHQIVGFSGTDSYSRLFPLGFRPQALPERQRCRHDRREATRIDHLNTSAFAREFVLMFHGLPSLIGEYARDYRCIIDVGALLAGVSVEDRAKEIGRLLLGGGGEPPKGRQGVDRARVVFFDRSGELHRCEVSSSATDVTAIDCDASITSLDFVLYDEAHCRGADVKMPKSMKAVVLLGPGIDRDKLQQALGRLRYLGRGQQALLFCSQSVARVLHVSGQPTVKDVFDWADRETARDNSRGALEWLQNELHFRACVYPTEVSVPTVAPELYGQKRDGQVTYDSAVDHYRKRLKVPQIFGVVPIDSESAIVEAFNSLVCGEAASVHMLLDAQCEREKAIEKEQMKEVEKQHKLVAPATEVAHNGWTTGKETGLDFSTKLSQSSQSSFPLKLSRNFVHVSCDDTTTSTERVRLVRWLIFLKEKNIFVCVTDLEAAWLLKSGATATSVTATRVLWLRGLLETRSRPCFSLTLYMPKRAEFALHLFSGETFIPDGWAGMVRELMHAQLVPRIPLLSEFCGMRNQGGRYFRSKLEKAECDALAE